MFEKILLPLDGSKLAENAIPYALDIAGKTGAEVFLLHVCPTEHQAYTHMHQIYLDGITDNFRNRVKEIFPASQEPKVRAEVISGEPTKVIFNYIKQNDINMVAMTTCGTSGIRIWALGSIADKVMRGVGIPTLLVRVKEGVNVPEREVIQRILLPLDISEASKIAVPYAVQLAKKLKPSITLFSMAQTIYTQTMDGTVAGVGANWDKIDAATEQYTDERLKGIENEIRENGVDVNRTVYLGLDAAYEILELESKIQADLVVMATRGRSPIARWAFGSVAEKVLREGGRPLMMVKEKGE
jgi:nucleotide-binding universal stress UspA family protein